MKVVSKSEFMKTAGKPIFADRDFSLYDGAAYDCVCGRQHIFSQFSAQYFASSGASAKFVVQCPDNGNAATLLQTKNKFVIMFDRFVSLAGCLVDE